MGGVGRSVVRTWAGLLRRNWWEGLVEYFTYARICLRSAFREQKALAVCPLRVPYSHTLAVALTGICLRGWLASFVVCVVPRLLNTVTISVVLFFPFILLISSFGSDCGSNFIGYERGGTEVAAVSFAWTGWWLGSVPEIRPGSSLFLNISFCTAVAGVFCKWDYSYRAITFYCSKYLKGGDIVTIIFK